MTETLLTGSRRRSDELEAWIRDRIRPREITKYLPDGRSFVDEASIRESLANNTRPDPGRVRDILKKSLSIQTLEPDEAACLLHVEDMELRAEMEAAAAEVKRKVYDNRIVTFAPLYLGNRCVNDCAYCGFRRSNREEERRVLTMSEISRETEVLAGRIGHKRLIVVYGEHPETDVEYMEDSLKTIASVRVQTRKGCGQIRRANINAAPLSIAELRRLHSAGIGTYQVFQETYHRPTYERVHPRGTIKGDYLWRLTCMHRSLEAGADDVGLGVLFGLYDWKFEVMGLLAHARELEDTFGIGPHTISFPRLEPASNTSFIEKSPYRVGDGDFRRLVTVIRLAVPYTGMILTARENESVRRNVLPLGCTQMDASTRIGLGGYAENNGRQSKNRQQFLLGDTRSLNVVIRELAESGYITSFCTAGYRCGRTGKRIMDLLRTGKEGEFCKLNAVLTFREWLDDFADPSTLSAGEALLMRELEEIRTKQPAVYPKFMEYYARIGGGERDLFF